MPVGATEMRDLRMDLFACITLQRVAPWDLLLCSPHLYTPQHTHMHPLHEYGNPLSSACTPLYQKTGYCRSLARLLMSIAMMQQMMLPSMSGMNM